MFSTLMKLLIASAVAIAAVILLYALTRIRREVPQEDRQYMDPLPLGLKLIWPLVNVFAYHIGQYLSVEYLERQKSLLQRSELLYLMAPEQFFGLQLLSALCCAFAAYTGFILLQAQPGYTLLLFALFGFFFPHISISDKKKRRELKIIKALPVFLDYLTMAVHSGLNLSGAILQAVDKGPDGPLKNEFQLVLRDIRAGKSRVDAFKTMANRLHLKEINNFASAIAQAEKTGSSLGDILQVQADQRRVERFQRAEKLALEAPVKLIFPLVAFIFPTTFAILAFPIIMKFMYEL